MSNEVPLRCQVSQTQLLTDLHESGIPAIVDGYAFIKGPKELLCLDLRARQAK
jgi:hypothetical protein